MVLGGLLGDLAGELSYLDLAGLVHFEHGVEDLALAGLQAVD